MKILEGFDINDDKYLEFCSGRQSEYFAAVREHGSILAASEAMGVHRSTIRSSIKSVRDKAARRGYSPKHDMVITAPEGYKLKGTSTLYDKDGAPKMQWVKTTADDERQEQMMREMIAAMSSDLPVIDQITTEKSDDDDLVVWFNIGDGHLGMLAHDQEVGHNFDLKIAEAELCHAFALMVERAPKTSRCVIQDLGDMTHYENVRGVTDASGHQLDFDTRFHKMACVYARMMPFMVETAARKYQNVDVIINQGNHSRSNDLLMAANLSVMYQKTPGITIIDNASVFIPYRMGNTFVMSHHGDKCKGMALIDVMSSDFRQDFGEAKYKYIDVGHVHHKNASKEYGDVTVESFNQLAPADKYAHDGGWRSRSCLTTIERSKTYGEKGRKTLTAEEVKDRLVNAKPGTSAQHRRKVHTV